MRRIVSFVKKHTVIIILISISILFPQSFSYQSKLNMRVIVTAIGVDKTDDEYEVTLQIVMPKSSAEQSGGTASLGFISEKGKSVSEGIQKVAYKIGKTAGLSHVSTLIVGKSMLDGNLAKELDFFVRNTELNSVVMLLISPKSAKEMITQTKSLEINEAIRLQKVFVYKQSSLNGLMMPIEEFINNSLCLSASSAASGILITNEGEEELGKNTDATLELQKGEQSSTNSGDSNQSGQKGSGSEQQSKTQTESTQKGRIKYYNDVYYFKNGKYINKFDKEEEIIGYYLTNKAPNSGDITAENINGDYLKNAKISFKFRKQETKTDIIFENFLPKLIFNVSFTDVKIKEILNGGEIAPAIYEFQAESSNTNIKKAISQRVEECVKMAFDKAKKDGVDVFQFANMAYQHKPKEWKKYYDEYGEAYLKNVEIEVNVNINNFN